MTMKVRKKILLTGASGLFGVNALFQGSSRYEMVGTYFRHRPPFSSVTLIQQDLTDSKSTQDRVRKTAPDCIIHAAADADIDHCELFRQEAYQNNVAATRTLATCAAELDIPMVFFSTDAFFEGRDRVFTEEDQPNPVNYYGETKALAEEIVRSSCPKHLIIRTNFFGWAFQNKPNLGEWIVMSLANQKQIPLFKDVIFSTLFVNTLAEIIFELVDLKQTGTFNITGDEALSKLQFGVRLCEAFGFDQQFITPSLLSEVPLKARRSTSMILSIAKLKKTLPNHDFSIMSSIHRFKSSYDLGYTQKIKGPGWNLAKLV